MTYEEYHDENSRHFRAAWQKIEDGMRAEGKLKWGPLDDAAISQIRRLAHETLDRQWERHIEDELRRIEEEADAENIEDHGNTIGKPDVAAPITSNYKKRQTNKFTFHASDNAKKVINKLRGELDRATYVRETLYAAIRSQGHEIE